MTRLRSILLVLCLAVVATSALATTSPSHVNPLSLAKPVDEQFAGVIIERVEAGSYRYLRVRDDAGLERWVATLGSSATSGRVSVHAWARAEGFESKRTGRTFSSLSFGSVTPTTPESK